MRTLRTRSTMAVLGVGAVLALAACGDDDPAIQDDGTEMTDDGMTDDGMTDDGMTDDGTDMTDDDMTDDMTDDG